MFDFFISHMIHVWYIYLPTFTTQINQNVGKYTSPMDPMGTSNNSQMDLPWDFFGPWTSGGVWKQKKMRNAFTRQTHYLSRREPSPQMLVKSKGIPPKMVETFRLRIYS